MHPFPHRYTVAAVAGTDGDVLVESQGLQSLPTSLPAQFGGSGDRWSPETLLVAAVADCFVMTFRGIAKASNLTWTSIACDVEGTLSHVNEMACFTAFTLRARLQVPDGTSRELSRRLLVKAEGRCLIARSLTAAMHLDATVETVTPSFV